MAQHEQDQATDGQTETELRETTQSLPEEEESEVSDQELVLLKILKKQQFHKEGSGKKTQRYGD